MFTRTHTLFGGCGVTRVRPQQFSTRTHLTPWQFQKSTWAPVPCWRQRQASSQRSQGYHATVCKAGEGGNFQPVQAVKKELSLQSTKLPNDLRERVERAVEALGSRVTVGDVAARAGVKLAEADRALQALTFDSVGALEVSNDGDVVYSLPKDFKSRIRNKSLLLQAEPALKALQGGAWYLLRVAFGSALIASVVLATVAIWVILNSSRSERDDRRGGYGYGGGSGFRLMWNLSDLFFYFDPYYYRDVRYRLNQGTEMSFPEAVFSLVFGDGDPNMDFDERRWKLVGQYIQSKGGVVTAEELAPFLDPPATSTATTSGGDGVFIDESYVLPVLLKFDGETTVDDNGNLLYKFPSLQTTGVQRLPPTPVERLVEEEPWVMTDASPGQVAGAVALGAANVAAVVVLSSLVGDPHARYVLVRQGLGFMLGLLPALQVYAASFFAIPAFRWVANQARNAAIEVRNAAREMAARRLARPTPGLQKKLDTARKEAKRKLVTERDVVYTTNKDVDEQMRGSELNDFDRRLQQSVSKKSLPDGGQLKAAPGKRWDDWVQRPESSQQKRN